MPAGAAATYWEQWSKWKDDDYDIATESLRDQIRRLRNHPSLSTYWYGSDNPPQRPAEKNYLAVAQGARLAEFRAILRQREKAAGDRADAA